MEMEDVDSSRIAKRGYDEKTKTCRIQFHKGGTYEYGNFPKPLWLAFKNSQSAGIFIDNHIKTNSTLTVKKV